MRFLYFWIFASGAIETATKDVSRALTKYDSGVQVTQESKQNASKRDQNQKLETLVAAMPQDRWESNKSSQKLVIRAGNNVFSKQPLAFNQAAI